jgi:hypothetical protein
VDPGIRQRDDDVFSTAGIAAQLGICPCTEFELSPSDGWDFPGCHLCESMAARLPSLLQQ